MGNNCKTLILILKLRAANIYSTPYPWVKKFGEKTEMLKIWKLSINKDDWN